MPSPGVVCWLGEAFGPAPDGLRAIFTGYIENDQNEQEFFVSAALARSLPVAAPEKFAHPDITAKGEARAFVPLVKLDTLWINTGTLCNITCRNCYIESSPSNDRYEYISAKEVSALLDEVRYLRLGTPEIGFTGGGPFLKPGSPASLDDTLSPGLEVLVLTNAMQPMQRPKVKSRLLDIKQRLGAGLTLRVSLDHHSKALHEAERGPKSWAKVLAGLDWLAEHGFRLAIAGRTCWGETEDASRFGYATLIAKHGWPIDPADKQALMLLPEMDVNVEVPEITTDCWGILHKTPADVMCATSRMVVKPKGAAHPRVLPCTLLPYDDRFEMGSTLATSLVANGGMFRDGAVKLCHPHCAKFCVLGGGSCS